jgi:hypothetical protein
MSIRNLVARSSVETLLASAPRAASGDSGPLHGFAAATVLRVQLDITAFTAAAGNTLDVVVEDSLDGTTWNVIATFAQRTATGREVVNVTSPFTGLLRVRWTVGGTPAPTFAVLGYARP